MSFDSFSLSAIPPAELLGFAGLAVALALVAGLVWGRSGRGRMRAEIDHLATQLRRAEATAEENSRATSRLRQEHGTVGQLAMSLPSVVRDLNRNDLETSEVPRLIMQLANAIFQPGKLLLYWVQKAKPDGDWKHRELRLAAQRGFDRLPESLRRIPMGKGKLGWVARHELDMTTDDWDKLRRTERVEVPDNDPSFRSELIGPVVRYTQDRQQVLGVLAVAELGTRPREAKLMLQMVTNFGSIALVGAEHMRKMRQAANHDGLTELLNKRSFLSDFGPKSLLDCEREGKRFSIFIFDIDHFKNYNDTNGHPAGDELLKQMARLIKANVRPGDMASRYGGEEFVLAMPDTDGPAALAHAEKVRQAVAATAFLHGERQPLGHVSISGGVATFPKDGTSVVELLQHADEALYQSKEGGRNQVRAYRGVDFSDNYDLSGIGPAAIDSPKRG